MCRTGISFDTVQKTITLTGFLGDGGYEIESYYFKNGEPFKVKYSYLNHYGAQHRDYQFNLPDEIWSVRAINRNQSSKEFVSDSAIESIK